MGTSYVDGNHQFRAFATGDRRRPRRSATTPSAADSNCAGRTVGRRARLRHSEPDRFARRPHRAWKPPATSCSSSTCSRTRPTRGCTSVTRSASSAPTCTPATSAWPDATCCTRWGSTRSACPPSSSPSRPASTRRSRPQRMSSTTVACAVWDEPRRAGGRSRPPTRRTTGGHSGSSPASSTRGTTTEPTASPDGDRGRARPIAELVAEYEAGTGATPDGRAWSSLRPPERAAYRRPATPGLRGRGAGQLVPGARHGRRQRGGHRRRRSDRGNFPVFKRTMRQWMMRITAYADRLIDDLDRLDWTDALKTMQRNWIGRVDRGEHRLRLPAGPIPCSRRPGHPVRGDVHGPRAPTIRWCRTYHRRAGRRGGGLPEGGGSRAGPSSASTRSVRRPAVFTGSYATNPATGDDIPSGSPTTSSSAYGTGRSWPCRAATSATSSSPRLRARHPPIELTPDEWFAAHLIEPDASTPATGRGVRRRRPVHQLVEPRGCRPQRHRRRSTRGSPTINEWLESRGFGEAPSPTSFGDSPFARQRYWGERSRSSTTPPASPRAAGRDVAAAMPDPTSSAVLVDPEDEFSEAGEPARPGHRVGRRDPRPRRRRADYRRDTNVMPQWAGSCWYELRDRDPANDEVFVDPAAERY